MTKPDSSPSTYLPTPGNGRDLTKQNPKPTKPGISRYFIALSMINFPHTCIVAYLGQRTCCINRGGEWKLHRYRYRLHNIMDTFCIHESGCATGINGRGFVGAIYRARPIFPLISTLFSLHAIRHSLLAYLPDCEINISPY